ncbi:hypothetical protein HMPREF1478_00714 [Actinomyces sp. HPA0247]|uniref:DUF6049 family protein n=1 Tax=Actinomyces sp. HPA0247 TaxID=1203556 RepID=UPI00034EB677|nr:DUF6049 family protein [Actinomyces sp. HPA0247]EPD73067.1 hypothetical protein HMPREF1478_00714 [Actinomyces sp. HPA0247]
MTRRAVRVAAACAALALPFGLGMHEAGAAPLPAQTSQSDASRPAVMGATAEASGLVISINSLSPRIVTSENEVIVSGTVRNDSPTTLANISLEMFVANETPISVAALTTALTEDEPDATHAASSSLTDITRGATVPFEIHIPTSSLPLTDATEWGPRVITVAANSGEYSGKDRSILVWDSGAQVSASRVNAVVPWTSTSATQDQAERSAVLNLAGSPGVTLAVDPLLIPHGPQPTASPSPSPDSDASHGQSGQSDQSGTQSGQSGAATASPSPSSSPTPTPAPTATDPAQRSRDLQSEAFVSALMGAANELIALPEGDADLGALALSGNTGFWDRASRSIAAFPSSLREAGWVAPTASPTTSPASPTPSPSASATAASATETPSPAASSSPSGQSGTTITAPDAGPTILRNVAWPADTTFGTAFLSNYASPDQITIAPASALTPAEEVTFTSYARVNVNPATGETATDGTGARTLAQQADLASILSWNASGGDELDAEQALAAITAIIVRERPASSRTLFAAAARGTTINESLTKRVNALFSPRWVSAQTFSDIASSEPTDVERQTVDAGTLDPDTSTAISAMSSSLTSLAPLAKATDDPDAVYDSVTPQILPSLAAQRTPSEQLDSATAMTSQITGMLSAVSVEPSSAVNLINKSANFPVLVRNNLPWPIHVDVTLVPDDPRLRATPALSQTLAAQGATTVEVPVGAIGSGDIEVTYKVTTPDGVVLDDSQTVTVRMRAGWEDAITAVIASLFGALFLVGITRSLRKRAARKAQGSPEADSTEAGSADAGSADEAPTDHNTESETATTKETP